MKFLPIALRLLLSYVVVAVLPVTVLATLYLTSFENLLRETVLASMTMIGEKKSDQIDQYLVERMNDAQLLSNSNTLRNSMSRPDKAVADKLRDADWIRRLQDNYNNMLLIDVDGNVVFSLRQHDVVGSRLLNGPLSQTSLAKGFRLAMLTGDTQLSHFLPYPPDANRPSAFVVAPLRDNGLVIGALALQLDMKVVLQVATDPVGLGQSGETVLAQRQGDEVLFITPLKQRGGEALAQRIAFNDVSPGMGEALAGNHARGIMKDYAGIDVVASWHYLPALDWAMVVKIDTEEALAPIAHIRNVTFSVLIVFFAVSLIVIYILARTITIPVRNLTNAAREISAGNLSQRVPAGSRDEIGLLGEAFNQMTSALEHSRNTLEKRVAERTRELQEASALHQAFLDNANALVIVFDQYGRICQYNHACELLSGYSAEEVKGKDFPPGFLCAEDVEYIRTETIRMLRDKLPFKLSNYRSRWLCRNGDVRLIDWNNSLIRDDQGHFRFVVAVGMDVTERQRAEDEVAVSAQSLKEAQRIAMVGSWELNVQTQDLQWSDEIYRLFEIDKQNYTPSYAAFLDFIHPADREQVDAAYKASLERHLPYEIVHRLLMPDGRIKWLRERGETFYDEQGQALISKGTAQDITEQKLIENELAITITRFKEAQRLARIGSWEYQLDSGRLYWSEQMYRLHGLEPQQLAAEPEASLAFYTPESAQKVREALSRILQQGGSFALELNLNVDSNVPRWVYSICNAVVDADNRILGLSGTVQDITTQKLLDDELDRHRHYLEYLVQERTAELAAAKELAEQANRAKSRFLSNMSHELRTPMNAILGFAQLLEINHSLDPAQLDYVHEILHGGYHLLALINEVLDLAKIESGKLDLELVPVCVCHLLDECFSLMKPLAAEKSISLQVDGASGLMVMADSTRLRQVLLNLLSNAIKYNARHGQVTVHVGRNRPGLIRIAVIDNGWGIAEENLAKLFQPFCRLQDSHGQVEGTGIGLAITRSLVEAMQGSISVDSQLGLGSCFAIELPELEAGESEEPCQGSSLSLPAVMSGGWISRKILYIEDNPANLKLVGRVLGGRDDIELLSSPNALLGLELAVSHRPDLVLLDINMPHMDGYKIINILKQDERLRHIPVIAITADAMHEDIERGKQAGFTDYLTKPLDIKQFLQVIGRYLDDQRQS